MSTPSNTVLQGRESILPTYARQDVTFVSGAGSWLVADSGERYLDLVGGIAVVGLGHCHPAPLTAAHEQLDRLWHTSNLRSEERRVGEECGSGGGESA